MTYTIAKYCTLHTPQRVETVFISWPQSSLYLLLHIRLGNQCMDDLIDKLGGFINSL